MHKKNYILFLADTSLILGQRLGEWCGHGPVLEQDIAMTNIALDYVGRARLLFQYIAEIDNKGKTEDDYAYLRDERDFRNLLLVEHSNNDFGFTVARQFFIDAFFLPYLELLSNSKDERLSQIAQKSLKETQYHFRWSSEWMIRLGDGTEESHNRIQIAVNSLWEFTGELFDAVDFEEAMEKEGVSVDLEFVKSRWIQSVDTVFSEATIQKPKDIWFQKGGKNGIHSEQLGYILSDMQFLQRANPGLEW